MITIDAAILGGRTYLEQIGLLAWFREHQVECLERGWIEQAAGIKRLIEGIEKIKL